MQKQRARSRSLRLLALVVLCLAIAPTALAAGFSQIVFGGPGDQMHNDAAALPDGGFLIVGSNSHVPGEAIDENTWGRALRLDAQGEVEWEVTHTRGFQKNRFERVVLLEDGGFVLYFAYFRPDTGTMRELLYLSAQGELQSVLPLAEANKISALFALDDGFLLYKKDFATALEEGISVLELVRIDAQGSEQWHQPLPFDAFVSGFLTLPQGLLAYGSCTAPESDNLHGFVALLDHTGELKWQRVIEADGDLNYINALRTEDGDLLLVGDRWKETPGPLNLFNGVIARFSPDGEQRWQQEYAYPGAGVQWTALQPYEDGYLILGEMEYVDPALRLVVVDGSGEVQDEWTFPAREGIFSQFADHLLVTENGYYAIVTTAFDSELDQELGLGNDIVIQRVNREESER